MKECSLYLLIFCVLFYAIFSSVLVDVLSIEINFQNIERECTEEILIDGECVTEVKNVCLFMSLIFIASTVVKILMQKIASVVMVTFDFMQSTV